MGPSGDAANHGFSTLMWIPVFVTRYNFPNCSVLVVRYVCLAMSSWDLPHSNTAAESGGGL